MKLFARRVSSRSRSAGKKGKRRLGLKLALALLVLGIGFGLITFYAVWAQTFDMKQVGQMPERNTVLDVDGKIYSRLAGANRLIVPINEVSPLFLEALLAREDTRFYKHGGLDMRGLLRAIVRNVSSGSVKEGASTITSSWRATVFRSAAAICGGRSSRRWLRCGLSGSSRSNRSSKPT